MILLKKNCSHLNETHLFFYHTTHTNHSSDCFDCGFSHWTSRGETRLRLRLSTFYYLEMGKMSNRWVSERFHPAKYFPESSSVLKRPHLCCLRPFGALSQFMTSPQSASFLFLTNSLIWIEWQLEAWCQSRRIHFTWPEPGTSWIHIYTLCIHWDSGFIGNLS